MIRRRHRPMVPVRSHSSCPCPLGVAPRGTRLVITDDLAGGRVRDLVGLAHADLAPVARAADLGDGAVERLSAAAKGHNRDRTCADQPEPQTAAWPRLDCCCGCWRGSWLALPWPHGGAKAKACERRVELQHVTQAGNVVDLAKLLRKVRGDRFDIVRVLHVGAKRLCDKLARNVFLCIPVVFRVAPVAMPSVPMSKAVARRSISVLSNDRGASAVNCSSEVIPASRAAPTACWRRCRPASRHSFRSMPRPILSASGCGLPPSPWRHW